MKIYEAADLMKNKIELLKTKRYKYVHTCIPSTKPKDRIKADQLQMMRYWYKIALNKITQKTTQRDEMRENRR